MGTRLGPLDALDGLGVSVGRLAFGNQCGCMHIQVDEFVKLRGSVPVFLSPLCRIMSVLVVCCR